MITAALADRATEIRESSNPQDRNRAAAGEKLVQAFSDIKTEGPLPASVLHAVVTAGGVAIESLAQGRSSTDDVAKQVKATAEVRTAEAKAAGTNNVLTPVSQALVGGMQILSTFAKGTSASKAELLEVAITARQILDNNRPGLRELLMVTRHDVTSEHFGNRDRYKLKSIEPASSMPSSKPLATPAAVMRAPQPPAFGKQR